MDPKELIEKARSGDKQAFGQLYQKFYLPVYRYIYLRINNKVEAADLTQTVFLKVYQSLDRFFQTDSEPLAYFFTVARNTVIDFYRKVKPVSIEDNEAALEVPDKADSPEEFSIKQELKSQLMEAINQLPGDQREVIVLKFISDLSFAEISEIMAKNEPAIRQIQHRALKKLAQILNKD